MTFGSRPIASRAFTAAISATGAIKAAKFSWQGFKAAFSHEEAFRQEIFLFLILAPIGFWLGDTGIEKAILIGSLVLVLIIELLNTGVEVAIDRIGMEKHELSGRAKDIGSAAVFISLANVWLMWTLVLFF